MDAQDGDALKVEERDQATVTDHYVASSSEAIHQAASLLHSAEVLLVIAGAGFSADSGLATYLDVADIDCYKRKGWRYRDLCRPFVTDADLQIERGQCSSDDEQGASLRATCEEDARHPQFFYGFWGQCVNDYRKVRPHEGYDIIARWGREKNTQSSNVAGEEGASNDAQDVSEASSVARQIREITRKLEQNNDKTRNLKHSSSNDYNPNQEEPYHVSPTNRAGAFFFFTSNVDAHSYDIFESCEIRECHGNTELWQCNNFACGTNASEEDELDGELDRPMDDCVVENEIPGQLKKWERRLWRLPLDHVFEVDSTTMSAPPTKGQIVGKGESSLARKRKSTSDTSNADDTVYNYLEHQFASADRMESAKRDTNKPTAPAHIGDVHGKPRTSHLKHMSHPTRETPDYFLSISPTDNWPKCPRCNELARPAVLMFDDLDWVYNHEQEKRWQRWYRSVMKVCKLRVSGDESGSDSEHSSVDGSDVSEGGWENVSEQDSEPKPMDLTSPAAATASTSTSQNQQKQQPLKVLILEIGCGFNVPTCRIISESLVKHLTDRGGDPTLVRINPTHPEADDEEIEDRFIGIEERGLKVLLEMDEVYRKSRRDSHGAA